MNNTNTFNKFLSGTLIFMLVALFFNIPLYSSKAASFTAMKDTMTKLKISTTADHTVLLTLPTGINFDRAGGTDILRYDFASTFSMGGTWVVGDFTFNDGTARTVQDITQGASPGAFGACTDGANTVGVKVDTDDFIITIEPCGASFTASGAAAIVTLTIDGTTSDGTLTNPSSGVSTTLALSMDDEGSSSAHTGNIALGIADDDVVTITATVAPTITFDIDTALTDTNSNTPYTVALGTITTSDSRVSGATDITVNYIWLDLDTNATGGAVITVKSTNGANGLVSTSVSADDIDSATGTIANGTENYGICVVTATAGTGTFTEVSPFNDADCTADEQTPAVGGLTTSAQDILNTAGAPIATGRAQITVAAAISAVTDAHDDYTDTLTFIATGTF